MSGRADTPFQRKRTEQDIRRLTSMLSMTADEMDDWKLQSLKSMLESFLVPNPPHPCRCPAIMFQCQLHPDTRGHSN